MKSFLILLLVCFLTIANISVGVAQCAMCKATVESNSKTANKSIGKGLNTGILYLMTIPYILVGVVGYMWYRNSRKNLKKGGYLRSNQGGFPLVDGNSRG